MTFTRKSDDLSENFLGKIIIAHNNSIYVVESYFNVIELNKIYVDGDKNQLFYSTFKLLENKNISSKEQILKMYQVYNKYLNEVGNNIYLYSTKNNELKYEKIVST